MEQVKSYMKALSSIRKAERRTKKMEAKFRRYVKRALDADDLDMAMMSLQSMQTLRMARKSLEEDRRCEVLKMQSQMCPICLDTMQSDIVVLQCGHFFHNACNQTWKTQASSCAVCREESTHNARPLCKECALAFVNMPNHIVRKGLQSVFSHANADEIKCHY
jgi:hypothetical protein